MRQPLDSATVDEPFAANAERCTCPVRKNDQSTERPTRTRGFEIRGSSVARGCDPPRSFQCKRCGSCCRWSGYVRLSPEEVDAIADFLRLPVEEFTRQYTVLSSDRRGLALTEHPDGSCVFHSISPSACLIEPVKPGQCRNFPLHWRFSGWEKSCAGARMTTSSDRTG